MEFKNYPKRIKLIKEIETFDQLTQEKQKQNRFSIKRNEMVLEEIEKSKFAQINEKRYIFSGRSSSLPFLFHIFMKLFSLKETKNKKIESFLQEEKHELIQM